MKFFHNAPSRDTENGIHCRTKHTRPEVGHGRCCCTTTGAPHHTHETGPVGTPRVLCTVCALHRQRGNQLECLTLCRGTKPRHRTRTTWTAGTRAARLQRLPQREPGLLELVQYDHGDVNQSPTEAARWCGRAESHQPQRATSRTAAPSGPTVAHHPPVALLILDHRSNLIVFLRLIRLLLLLGATSARHEAPASVDSIECGGSADQERASSVALFSSGEKCEKTLHQRVQEKPKKTLRNPGLVEKFEHLHPGFGDTAICSKNAVELCPRCKP